MAGRQRANGEGSIRERYPGCWEGRYTAGYDILTGKRIQKGVFAKTRKECAAKLARAIQQDTGPYYRKGKGYDSQPLSTWIRLWFDSYTKPNLRPSSADGYRSMIENHIIPVLGHIQLSKLSSIQIQRFYNDLHTQGRLDNHGNRKYEPLSASTVKHIHAVLSGALKQAVKERIIPFNPCDNCKIPKREKKEMHVLPQDKIGAYLDEAKRLGVYALFYLELTSGLRRGELLGLEWADLNPETRMLTVNKQLTRSGGELCISVPKTENSIRTIALPENTVALLIDEHNKHPDTAIALGGIIMLQYLKNEANLTHTENGAVTYQSTQSECLDLFATIGALRRESDEEITNRFLRAYAENADLAMKTLFFARDVRGGIGERRVFRTILKWLASNEPRSLEKNIQYIAEYGRYDDLLALMGTTCEGKVLQLIKKQLAADFAALEAGESVSLLAKWLPSVNASNEDVIRQAKRIARAMGMNDAQ